MQVINQISYFLVSLAATTIGSLTGMGGGVIIKPVLDALGQYDAATIGILSSVTVFAMSLVSISKQKSAGSTIRLKLALPVCAGSILGGMIGQNTLTVVIAVLQRNETVVALQNVLLFLLVGIILIYMCNKHHIKPLKLAGLGWYLLTGMLLGFFSSFLGIGGGPINVAIFVFFFGMDTKAATLYSLVTILFSQITKLATVQLTVGLAHYNLKLLPAMVLGGIIGGLLGAGINRRVPNKKVELCFNSAQVLVLLISVYNIACNI